MKGEDAAQTRDWTFAEPGTEAQRIGRADAVAVRRVGERVANRHTDAPAAMLLGSYRSDEVVGSAFLTAWTRLREVADPVPFKADRCKTPCHKILVGPLSESDCCRLVQSRVGSDDAAISSLAREIFHSTGGNPYLVEQLIDCFDAQTGEYVPMPLDELIKVRLGRLPREARSLLDVVAVSGRAIPTADAAVAAATAGSAFATLTHMRSERLVRLVGSGQQELVDTYHDKIREAVLDHLGESRQRDLHHALGTAIEDTESISHQHLIETLGASETDGKDAIETPARVYELAYHFEAAGDQTRAFVYSLLSAEQAKAQFALEVAVERFEAARNLSHQQSARLRYRALLGLGVSLLQLGRYEQAEEALGDAAAVAVTERDRITVRMQQAEIVYKTRSLVESVAEFEDLLRALGASVPRGKPALILGIIRICIQHALAAVLPRRSHPRTPDWKEVLAARVLHQATYPSCFRDPLKSVWMSFLGYRLAERNSDQALQCSLASAQGMTNAWFLRLKARARRCHDEALQTARRLNNRSLEAQAFFLRASAALSENAREALECAERSVSLCTEIGDAWRITYSEYVTAVVHARLGNTVESVDACRKTYATAIRYGQHRLAQSVIESWATATGGNFPYDELRAGFQAVPDDHMSTIGLHVAESAWHRHHGRTEEAVRAAEDALIVMRQYWPISGLLWPTASSISSVAYPNRAHALRVHADAVESSDPVLGRRLRKRALQAARQAVRIERLIRLDMAYALRELSLACAGFSKTRSAYRYARQSCSVARQQDSRYQYAQSLLVCGQLGESLGVSGARKQIEEAEASLAEFDRVINELHDQKLPTG